MAAFSTQRNTRCDGRRADPITRDFLGGSFGVESIELDLDSRVPRGWEKRLDPESGKLYVRRVSPSPYQTVPSCSRAQSEPSLDLSLDLGIAAKTPSKGIDIYENATYRSVITLDNVRSALERISTSLGPASKKRLSPNLIGSGSTSFPTGSVVDPFGSVKVAVACPFCLMYVMVLLTDHKCPKCGGVVPMAKKPRVDLSMSI